MTTSIRPAGDRGALIEFAESGDAVRVARALAGRAEFVDVVPGHRTVLVTWAREARPQGLDALVGAALAIEPTADPGRFVEIPVVYDGVDLPEVARLANISAEEVVERHLAADYTVAFIGFAPGFAYLIGGDDLLDVPRLAAPRKRVPAGSVAIAGPYSAVYPRDSPGGWQLLGRTPLVLFDPSAASPALLAAGDRVRFVLA